MEYQLNKAVGNALGLQKLQRLVVTANIQLRDKINILRAAIRLSPQLTHDQIGAYHAVLTGVSNATPKRNMMAHDLFWADKEGDGVEFNVVKAKNELDLPPEIWSISKFTVEIGKIDGWADLLEQLANVLGTPAPINSLFALSLLHPSSSGELLPSEIRDHPSPQLPEPPDSSQSTTTQGKEP